MNVQPCPICGEIPADELYKSIPVLSQTQLLIVGSVLVPILIVCFVFAIRFLVKYMKD